MPESPEEYKDRWLEERFTNIQFQLQHLRERQEETRLAVRELRDEMRGLHQKVDQVHDGLRREISQFRDEVRNDNLKYFQATMRWLVGTAIALSALMVALFSLFSSAGT